MSFNILLVGVPRSVVKRVRAALQGVQADITPWTITLIPSVDPNNGGLAQSQVSSVLDKAAEFDGAVIFGVPGSQARNFGSIEQQIRPYFRYRRFPMEDLGLSLSEPAVFRGILSRIIEEENYWLERIKPKDSYSPLILPSLFCSKHYSGIWRLAESYNDLPNLREAEKLLAGFLDRHKKKVMDKKHLTWVDSNECAWDDRGPRHGNAKFPETWKYSHRILEGLHFDVSHAKAQVFEYVDCHGIKHRVKKGPREYLNITPYGAVRGSWAEK